MTRTINGAHKQFRIFRVLSYQVSVSVKLGLVLCLWAIIIVTFRKLVVASCIQHITVVFLDQPFIAMLFLDT